MKTSTLLVLALALAAASAGCIENMRDLKDRVGAGDEPVEPATVRDSPPTTQVPAANNTTELKPPVARITIFGDNGALVYKATFKGDDATEPIFVPEKSRITLMASDSEALQPGATLAKFTWSFAGKTLDGRQVATEVGEAGKYDVVLMVVDSNGRNDTQSVVLAVAPKPFDVVTELVTGPVAGAEGEGQSGTATFELKLADAKVPAKVQAVTVKAASPAACDAILTVADPDGEALGTKDDTSVGEAETLSFGELAEGAYTITVAPFACVAPEGVPVTVTVTFLPVIEGLGEADAHGGHAH